MFRPDTPANRALFRAVRAQDVEGVRAALGAGADPNALWGRGKLVTCSPLMRAVEFEHGGCPRVVEALLDGGADMWGMKPGQGRYPLREALCRGSVPVIDAFVRHAGGPARFFAQAQEHRRSDTLLEACLYPAMAKPEVWPLFALGLEQTPVPHWPQRAGVGAPWPWGPVACMNAATPEALSALARHVPRPTPETLGQDAWSRWMAHAALRQASSAFFRTLCQETPAAWWLARHANLLSVGPKYVPPHHATVLGVAVAEGNLTAARAALAAVRNDPVLAARFAREGNWLDIPTTLPVLRLLVKKLGAPALTPAAALRQAWATAESSMDPHHRTARLRFLVAAGADPFLANPATARSVFDALLSWPRPYREAFIEDWERQGMDWDAFDGGPATRLARLRAVDPEAAARRHAARLATLPSPAPTPSRPRL